MTVLCIVCLILSVALTSLFVANWIDAIRKRGKGFLSSKKTSSTTLISPFHWMVLGVFLSITVLFIPIYLNDLDPSSAWATYIKTPFLAAQNALQLFVLNAGFDNVRSTINSLIGISQTLADIYTVYVTFYFVIAPLLTGAVALSLVKGLYENWRYFRKIRVKEIHVFSELNENSLALATDILARAKRTIVFANVTSKMQEENADLVSAAGKLGAICLQKDIDDVSLKSPDKPISRKLYLISQNENENISKALQLIERCHKNYNFDTTHVYVFANSDESSILIDSVISKLAKKEVDGKEVEVPFNIKVRRVNEKRNLIWNALCQSESELDLTYDDEGEAQNANNETVPAIFSRARQDGEKKVIDVLIVGLGQYGTELLKTVCWYCQMPGYTLNVHVFDGLANCQEKIRSIAPDLVALNGKPDEPPVKGEAHYVINFCNDAIDVREASFADKIASIANNVTMAFVTLGDDQMNIDTAIKLRRIFGKALAGCQGYKVPPILTVVYDSEKAERLNRGKLLKNDSRDGDYNIRFIGDLNTSYSLRNVEQAELENSGLACHMHWAAVNQMIVDGDADADYEDMLLKDWRNMEKTYNTYEYSRRSSMAQIMHLKAREQLRLNCNRETLMENEHKRWNAYMRADGYTRSPEVNGKRLAKDTVAKIHPDLVAFDQLKPQTQEKDDMPEYSKLLENYKEKSKRFEKAPQ